MNNIIIGVFTPKEKVKSFSKFLYNKFNITKMRIFIYEIECNENEYLITFKVESKTPYLTEIKGSTSMHTKNGCFFSINALNRLIEIENNLSIPNNEFVLNWDKYKDKLILLTNGVLSIKKIKKLNTFELA